MCELTETIDQYIRYCRYDKNLSRLTIKAYQQDLKQFTHIIGKNSSLKKINKENIRNYIQELYALHLKETSIKRKVAALKAFLRYLEYEDKISVSPFRKLNIRIRVPKKIPRYLSMNDIRLLYSQVRNTLSNVKVEPSISNPDRKSIKSLFAIQTELIILEILFTTGIRVSELCNLNIDDVDLNKRNIRVLGKGSRERDIAITNDETILVIERYIRLRKRLANGSSPLLLNRCLNRIQPHSIRSILKNVSSFACLNYKITPHMFRHTVATMLIENGLDTRFVQKFLGHSSILTTQIYTNPTTLAERQQISMKHPRNFV
ncbi:MAG: tyrosine-type recombinase/integrase [Ignavibacteriales bacterium]|nr:tyrosine-type recombinase/integrase [Ignavibacteriales bacterium]